jgi:hypothetical protein
VAPISPLADPIPCAPPQLSSASIKAQPILALSSPPTQRKFYPLFSEVLIHQAESISELIKAIEGISKNTALQMRQLSKWMDPDMAPGSNTPLTAALMAGGPEVLVILHETFTLLHKKLTVYFDALTNNFIKAQPYLPELVQSFHIAHLQLLGKLNEKVDMPTGPEAEVLPITAIPLLLEIQKTLKSMIASQPQQNA